jgi:hypothetical protein
MRVPEQHLIFHVVFKKETQKRIYFSGTTSYKGYQESFRANAFESQYRENTPSLRYTEIKRAYPEGSF